MGKRISTMLLIVGICLSVTACSPVENLFDIMDRMTDNDNPLSGKSTDERIIMSLEDTYPEHTFSAIKSFDNDKGEGFFSDENGIEFRVHNLIYNNTYHFGCEDDYLETILNDQNYISQASDIATKYGYVLAYDEQNEIVSIQYSADFQQTDDFSYYSKMVYEILNVVEVPTVVDPDTEFSTGEVNYYSRPCMGTLLCDITYNTSKTSLSRLFKSEQEEYAEILTAFLDAANQNDIKKIEELLYLYGSCYS